MVSAIFGWVVDHIVYYLQHLDWVHIMNDVVIGGLYTWFRQYIKPSVATPLLPPAP
jgi:hypothetical protein